MSSTRTPSTEASTSGRVTRSRTIPVSVKDLSTPTTTVSTVRKKPKTLAQQLAEKILENPDKPQVTKPEYQTRITNIVSDTKLDRSSKIDKLTKIMKEYMDKSAQKRVPRSSTNKLSQTITIDVNALYDLPKNAIEKIIQHANRSSIKDQAQMAKIFKIEKFEFVPMIQKFKSDSDAYPQDYDQDKIPNLLKTYEYSITHAKSDTDVMNDDTPLGKIRNTTILLRSDIITIELGLLLESHETFLYMPLDGRVFLDITIKPTTGTKLQISMCGKLIGKKIVIDDAFNAQGSYSKLPDRSLVEQDEATDIPNVLVSTIGNINLERASELLSIASKWIKKYLISTIEVKAKARANGTGEKLLNTFVTQMNN